MVMLDDIQALVRTGDYYISRHADVEMHNDDLSITEIEEALLNGVIIEQYPDTGRGQSCLVAGFTKSGKPVHIVSGFHTGCLTIVTVYVPTPPKFRNPFERGRS